MNSFRQPFLWVFLFMPVALYCQWMPMDGPYGGLVRTFSGDKDFLLTGNSYQGAYMSTDHGDSWIKVTGGPDSISHLYGVDVLDSIGLINGWSEVSLGVDEQLLFLTKDYGKTWKKLPEPPGGYGVLITKDRWYLRQTYGFFVSTDEGETWAMTPPVTTVSFYGLSRWKDKVISTYPPFLFISTADPLKWKSTSGPYDLQMHTVSPAGDLLINHNPYFPDTIGISFDGSATWTLKKIPSGEEPLAFIKKSDTLYMCTTNGLFVSPDLGDSWDVMQWFPPYVDPTWSAEGENDFYIRDQVGGLFRVNIQTNSIKDITRGLPFSKVLEIIPSNGGIFALDESRSIQQWSESDGWTYPSMLWPQQRALTMTAFDDRMWVSSEPFKVYRSLNSNASLWKEIPLAAGVDAQRGVRFEPLGDTLLLLCEDKVSGNTLLYTTAPYQSWKELTIVHPIWGKAHKLVFIDKVWFALFPEVLARSFDQGGSWEQIAENLEKSNPSLTYVIKDLRRVGDWLIIDHVGGTNSYGDKRIWYSSDLGNFWTYKVDWDPAPLVYKSGHYFYSMPYQSGLFIGPWLDANGISISDNLIDIFIRARSFAIDDKFVYLGSEEQGVWRRAISEILPVAIEPTASDPHSLRLTVYPNPSSGQITIGGLPPYTEAYNWSLVDLNGKLALQGKQEDASVLSIDIYNLPRGAYIIQASNRVWQGHTLLFRQ